MMDAVTLTIVCGILLPSTGFGKPFVTDTASFILKAPDNDTGTWIWKTANSKVSFRHFHRVGDDPGEGYWTLEVTHSEAVPKHIQKVKELHSEAVPKHIHKVKELHSEAGPKRSHKDREVASGSSGTNSVSNILVLTSQEAPPDLFQEQKRVAALVLVVDKDKSSAELMEEFLEGIDETEGGLEQIQESKPETKSDFEDLERTLTQRAAEQADTKKEEDEEEDDEENWWLAGEDLVDEEEDGYFHVRDIIRVKLYDLGKDWQEARRKCRRDGGDLAVPDTERKALVIFKLLHRYPQIPASAILRNQVYVGIHDPTHHRDWITVKGDAFTEDFWAPGEPDNEHPGEDCVTFRTDGRIRDVPCFYSLPFVCEKPLPPSEQIE